MNLFNLRWWCTSFEEDEKEKIIRKLTHFENDLHVHFYRDANIDDRKEFIKEWIFENIE